MDTFSYNTNSAQWLKMKAANMMLKINEIIPPKIVLYLGDPLKLIAGPVE